MSMSLIRELGLPLILKLRTLQVQWVQAYLLFNPISVVAVTWFYIIKVRQGDFSKLKGKYPYFIISVRQTKIMRSSPGRNYFKVKRKNKSRLEFRFWWYAVMSLANLLFLVICEVFIVMGYQIHSTLERFTNLLTKYNEQNEAGDKG